MGRKSKLTEKQWDEIQRRSKKESLRKLGKEFDINHAAISRKLKEMASQAKVTVEKKKVTTPEVKPAKPPAPIKPRKSSIDQLQTQLKAQSTEIQSTQQMMKLLLEDSRIPPERHHQFRIFMDMDEQTLNWTQGVGMLLTTLQETREEAEKKYTKWGNPKFKKRDLRDLIKTLGQEQFDQAWDFCMAIGLIVLEDDLSEGLAEELNVKKTTGKRYVFNHLRLDLNYRPLE